MMTTPQLNLDEKIDRVIRSQVARINQLLYDMAVDFVKKTDLPVSDESISNATSIVFGIASGYIQSIMAETTDDHRTTALKAYDATMQTMKNVKLETAGIQEALRQIAQGQAAEG